MGLSLKKIGKGFSHIAHPLEVALRPVVKTAAHLVPGGDALLSAQETFKRDVYDPLRKSGSGMAAAIKQNVTARAKLLGATNEAANTAQDFAGNVKQSWLPVAVACGLLLVVLGKEK